MSFSDSNAPDAATDQTEILPQEMLVPAPTGLGQPRRVRTGLFAQDILPGMEPFIEKHEPEAPPPAAEKPVLPEVKQTPRTPPRWAGACAAAGLGFCAALLLAVLWPSTPETAAAPAVEDDAIPAELLDDAETIACWRTVKDMHGEIDGVPLAFRRGRAEADGTEYRVVLEFVRTGNTTLTKVAGDGLWAVKVNPDGRILRAYRWRNAERPLKSLVE